MTNITGGIKATNVASFLVNWKKFVLRIQWFRQSNKIWSWLINICPSPAIYMRLVKRIMNNHQLFLLKSFAEFHRGHFMNKKKYRHVQEDYIKIPLNFHFGIKSPNFAYFSPRCQISWILANNHQIWLKNNWL